MSSLVLELQQEVLSKDFDVLTLLRKAHLIAKKLNLLEFDSWIMSELNGYDQSKEDIIPSYRKVSGTLLIKVNGVWTPMVFVSDSEMERDLCEDILPNSISEFVELIRCATDRTTFQIPFSGHKVRETIKHLENDTPPLPMCLNVSIHRLQDIVEKVKNCILEWTITLESKGILGEKMSFSKKDAELAQTIPQQVHNYYGNVVFGNVNNSQLVSGNDNTIIHNSDEMLSKITDIRNQLKKEVIDESDRNEMLELVDNIEDKINKNKKTAIIKSMFVGLKDFALNVGANVTASLITSVLQN